MLGVVAAAAGIGMTASAANAYSVNFGCSSGSRTIAATAYYSAPNASQWYVSSIDYSYSNSGGGKTNSTFTIYNGANAAAWTWSTPDDRTNRSYSKSVQVYIARGRYARAYQKTWFDVFGPDPSCNTPSAAGYF